AILGDYPKEQAKDLIHQILDRLLAIQLKPELLKKYVFHLTTLARLRRLEIKTTQEVQTMPIEYDITTDGLYLEGLEVGLEQGLERGLEKGLEQGKQQAIE
ncbi:hypothetical protein RZS08_48380, partial [Arthrospira platensis SPKY1]|nr:hypothetical protein [Arthrospira platensis SPKY1]